MPTGVSLSSSLGGKCSAFSLDYFQEHSPPPAGVPSRQHGFLASGPPALEVVVGLGLAREREGLCVEPLSSLPSLAGDQVTVPCFKFPRASAPPSILFHKDVASSGVPWWLGGLRTWHWHCCGSDHCCGMGSISGLESPEGCSQGKKKKKKKEEDKVASSTENQPPRGQLCS